MYDSHLLWIATVTHSGYRQIPPEVEMTSSLPLMDLAGCRENWNSIQQAAYHNGSPPPQNEKSLIENTARLVKSRRLLNSREIWFLWRPRVSMKSMVCFWLVVGSLNSIHIWYLLSTKKRRTNQSMLKPLQRGIYPLLRFFFIFYRVDSSHFNK